MKKWVNGLAICVAIAACFGTGVHRLLEVKLVKLLKQVQKPPCLILKQHQPVRQHHKQLHTKQRLQKVARP